MEVEKLNQQYLRIVATEECEQNELLYASKVLQKRDMETLLNLRRRSVDGKILYYYSIDGVHSMAEVWDERFLTVTELDWFLRDLNNAIRELEGYLLKQEQLFLHPAYVMYDTAKRKWKFIYLLDPHYSQKDDMVELLEFWMNKLGGDETEDAKIYEYLADCMQFEEDIRPSELVHLWTQRVCMEQPVLAEGTLEGTIEPVVEKAGAVRTEEKAECVGIERQVIEHQVIEQRTKEHQATEWDMPSRKARWNRLVYEKLYRVPFSPH